MTAEKYRQGGAAKYSCNELITMRFISILYLA
uniref:Uncharacterized protein n=1 Tax=Arundo donax TaxID=35708 RepID=A0A0A8XUY0_ARUDO